MHKTLLQLKEGEITLQNFVISYPGSLVRDKQIRKIECRIPLKNKIISYYSNNNQ